MNVISESVLHSKVHEDYIILTQGRRWYRKIMQHGIDGGARTGKDRPSIEVLAPPPPANELEMRRCALDIIKQSRRFIVTNLPGTVTLARRQSSITDARSASLTGITVNSIPSPEERSGHELPDAQ